MQTKHLLTSREVLISAIWLIVMLFIQLCAQAQTTYTVNTLTDNNPNGAGVGNGLQGDLRYALNQSNANPSNTSTPNKIIFLMAGQIDLGAALPTITSQVFIEGHSNGTTLNRAANTNFRLLTIEFTASVVYLSNLTFKNGQADFGGAIYNFGAFLKIERCKFINNEATLGGGAILQSAGIQFEISHSLFQGNRTQEKGGAILTDAYMRIYSSAFIENLAEQGGALYTSESSSSEIINTTFSGNQANQNGSAGIKQGGAIYNLGDTQLINNTLTLNSAQAGQGGGIYNENVIGLFLQNNIIAENGTGGDIKNNGNIASNIKNLVMDCNACGITWFSTADPALLPLQDNGAAPPSHPLSAQSPAINQGERFGAPIDDQRGYTRVGLPDLGAHEFAAPLNGGRGYALTLDGQNDYAHLFTPLMATRDDNFSIEAWVKLTETPNGQAIVAYNGLKGIDGYGILINNTRKALLQINNTVIGEFGEVSLNTWTHLAISKIDTEYRGFINGEETLFTFATEPNFPTGGFYVGGLPSGENFKGQIDELRVWATHLGTSQVRQRMHITLLGNENFLTHYYQFNAGNDNRDEVGGRHLVFVNGINTSNSDAPVELGNLVDVISHQVNTPNSTTNSIGGLEINWGAQVPNGEIVVSFVRETPINSPGFVFGGGYWIINNFGTNQTFSPISLKFRFADDVMLNPDVNSYELYKRPSNSIGEWIVIKNGIDGVTVTVSNTPGDKYVEFVADPSNTQLISFSQFVLKEASTPLGVRWLHFEASRIDDAQVKIKWQTTDEINNEGFAVQFSTNGIHFENITWIPAATHQGGVAEYEFIHTNSQNGYYRVVQIDQDGTRSYTGIKFVRAIMGIKVYPNPSTDKIALDILGTAQSNSLNLDLVDIKGQHLLNTYGTLQEVQNTLDTLVPQLKAGQYIIRLLIDGQMFTQKFIKQ